MSINRPTLIVEPEELDRFEELVRYLAAHDGRMPTDEMPLAWWVLDMLDRPRQDPVRILFDCIPLRDLATPLSPKRADVWVKCVQRLDQIDLMGRRGESMEDRKADDLGKWAEATILRYLSGKMKPAEELLLRRREAWSFERPLSPKRRSDAAMAVGLRAIREFHKKHGHTDVPDSVVIEGVNLRLWWQFMRDRYAGKAMKPHDRQRLEGLKLDLRSDTELAKEKAAEERMEAQRAQRRAKLAAQRGVEDIGPVLDAIRAFAERHGHTGIPVGATTIDGVEFGRHVDRWRRQYARAPIEKGLRRALEGMPHWVWMRTPGAPVERPAPAPIPEDTTQMNRSGLRQFLPGD